MNLRKKLVGKRVYGTRVDITDPCYDSDTWCRINNVKIKAGEYTCRVWIEKNKYECEGKTYEYTTVGVIGIYFNDFIPLQKSMEHIGDIGVDAGLAGFFENKPDYANKEWSEFCDKINNNKNAWIFDEGFFSSSGHGDGMYPVYAYKNNEGEIIALEIRFM